MIIKSALTGHTLFVSKIAREELPKSVTDNASSAKYAKFYVVKNWDANGIAFMYLAKGHSRAPRQICAFYRNGQLWSSYGTTIKAAIEGAQRDGWMYT